MKYLFEFSILEKITSKEVQKQTVDGKEIEVLTPVISNEVRKFAIKKPNRTERDESELFFSVERAKFIRAGLLTIAELRKRILNDGGYLADTEKERLKTAWERYLNTLKEYNQILLIEKDKQTEANKARILELDKLKDEDEAIIRESEVAEFMLFEETADARARNKTIFWWTLLLSYQIIDGKPVAVFGEGDYSSKAKKYEEFEENEDKFKLEVFTKFTQLISMWYAGKAATEAEFNNVLEFYKNQDAGKSA